MVIKKEIAAKLNKIEIAFDPSLGWPNGADIFYECLICRDIISSIEDAECRCSNLYVDAAAGRAGAKREKDVRLLKMNSTR
jgi:hypothetical protein